MANMPDFISYKHMSAATKQFNDHSKLGEGGFGSVYRGKLSRTGQLVAVKKVAADSRQGEREFLVEVQINRCPTVRRPDFLQTYTRSASTSPTHKLCNDKKEETDS